MKVESTAVYKKNVFKDLYTFDVFITFNKNKRTS